MRLVIPRPNCCYPKAVLVVVCAVDDKTIAMSRRESTLRHLAVHLAPQAISFSRNEAAYYDGSVIYNGQLLKMQALHRNDLARVR
jgi:hypothetical protein